MLDHKPVLIVEANAYLALDLCVALERLGATIVGPASTFAEAQPILEEECVAGAVLDCDMPDEGIKPMAKLLARRNIPFVLQCTEALPPEIAMIRPGAPILIRPISARDVALVLANEITAGSTPSSFVE